MKDALAWLSPRVAGAPKQLEQRMTEALQAVAAQRTVQDQLAEAALWCLRRSLEEEQRAEKALQLLAADALLTHACEAAAEMGSDALTLFTATWNANRFESLLT